jgi:thiol-disulfide isomerase/thioredoxin
MPGTSFTAVTERPSESAIIEKQQALAATMPPGARARRLKSDYAPAEPLKPLGLSAAATALPSFKRDLLMMVAMLLATGVLTAGVLWWLGALGSGVWKNVDGSRVTFVGGDPFALDKFFATNPGRSLVIAFYSEHCLHCKQMRQPFLAASRNLPDLTFVAIEASGNMAIAKSFHLNTVPALLFLPSSSQPHEFTKFAGSISVDTIRHFLDQQLLYARREDGNSGSGIVR